MSKDGNDQETIFSELDDRVGSENKANKAEQRKPNVLNEWKPGNHLA